METQELDEYSPHEDVYFKKERVPSRPRKKCKYLLLGIVAALLLLQTIQIIVIIATYAWLQTLPINFDQIHSALGVINEIDFGALSKLTAIDFAAVQKIDFGAIAHLIELAAQFGLIGNAA